MQTENKKVDKQQVTLNNDSPEFIKLQQDRQDHVTKMFWNMIAPIVFQNTRIVMIRRFIYNQKAKVCLITQFLHSSPFYEDKAVKHKQTVKPHDRNFTREV